MRDLFRREVLNQQGRRLAGDVILATPPGAWPLTAVVVAAVITALTFATLAPYARTETVTGWIVPSSGLIRLVAQDGGIVESVSVREGDRVRAGEPIAVVRLSPELAGRDAIGELAESLEARGQAAQLRAQAAQAALRAEQTRLAERVAGLERQIAEARSRVVAQEGRVALARDEVRRAEQIFAQGFLPRRELDLRRAGALSEDGALAELRGDLLALEDQIAEARARQRSIPIDARAAEADATSTAAILAGERTRTDREGAYVVTATVDGVVAALPVRRGQAVSSEAALAVLMPAGASLGADLYVPTRAAGFIAPGQPVRLMYQAFPHQKFGTGSGRIVTVSQATLAPRDIDIPGLTFSEPMYRIRVALDRPTVPAYGRDMPLRPGMLLTADIVIDRRSLLEWLLDPLYAAGHR
jgi:membrane fusion protein